MMKTVKIIKKQKIGKTTQKYKKYQFFVPQLLHRYFEMFGVFWNNCDRN